jgi:hypothetical protein
MSCKDELFFGQMDMINRSVITVKPNQPFKDWVNGLPTETYQLWQLDHGVAYLVPEFEKPEEIQPYIQEKFNLIFRCELRGWCDNEELWPPDLSYSVFVKWFDVEYSFFAVDTKLFEQLYRYSEHNSDMERLLNVVSGQRDAVRNAFGALNDGN